MKEASENVEKEGEVLMEDSIETSEEKNSTKPSTPKFKWYTNGAKTVKVYDGTEPPEGFWQGRIFNSNPWNKGKTKKDDSRIKTPANVFQPGNISWNTGLTKEISHILQRVAEKVSEKNKGRRPHNLGVPMSEESKRKLSQSHMGLPSYWKGKTKETNPTLAKISQERQGHEVSEETIEKGWLTKKKNGTCKSSKPEEEMYKDLCNKYGKENILRQYKDAERYPFSCDFYIISEDLFIELNLFWTHNNHPFDNTNENDVKELEKWKEKAKIHPQYKAAVKTWSIKDVNKLNMMRKNHLNFKVIYKHFTITE